MIFTKPCNIGEINCNGRVNFNKRRGARLRPTTTIA